MICSWSSDFGAGIIAIYVIKEIVVKEIEHGKTQTNKLIIFIYFILSTAMKFQIATESIFLNLHSIEANPIVADGTENMWKFHVTKVQFQSKFTTVIACQGFTHIWTLNMVFWCMTLRLIISSTSLPPQESSLDCIALYIIGGKVIARGRLEESPIAKEPRFAYQKVKPWLATDVAHLV